MNELTEYGALGLMVLASGTIIGILWKFILNLLQQVKELNKYHTDRYDQQTKHYETRLYETINSYEKLVKELVTQQGVLHGTLEALQEGLAAKDLLTEYIRQIGIDREKSRTDDRG